MRFKRTFSLLVVAGLASGCAVGPDYIRPQTAVSEHYLGQAAIEQRQPGTKADLVVWWEGFGDPQLTRLVTLALEQNLDLAQASARVTQAQAGLGVANANLLPSGDISVQGARAYQSIETLTGRVLNARPNFNRYNSAYETNLSVGWETDIFGGARREREAALAEYQASAAGATATRLTVAAQTADIYINIRGLQIRLDVARRQVQTQKELLSMINLLYTNELAAELQVRQAEGALAQVQATVPVLESALETSMNAMDVMLGAVPGTYRAELSNPAHIPVAPQVVSSGTPGDLLRRRPDLIVAERRLAASNARIGVVIAEYYPKLSFSGLIGSATSVSSSNLFSSGANQSAGLLGLRWRLFDFDRINAEINLAKGQEAEALAGYRLAVLRATEEVENAFLSFVKRGDQADLLTHGVDSLGRARNVIFGAYQQGTVSLIEVLQADESVLRASDLRARAQTESARAAVAAFKALGGGWQAKEPETVASR